MHFMEHSNRLRIVIADRHSLFRAGIRGVLSREMDLQIVGEAGTLEECAGLLRSAAPDLILLESQLASEKECEGLRAIQPSVALLLLVAAESAANSASAGDETCLLRSEAATHAVASIRALAGRRMMPTGSASQAAKDLQALATSTAGQATLPGLTMRENEIVRILTEGRTAREVAEELGLSIKTVEAHKLNVMRKLGVHNRSALLRYAAEHAASR